MSQRPLIPHTNKECIFGEKMSLQEAAVNRWLLKLSKGPGVYTILNLTY